MTSVASRPLIRLLPNRNRLNRVHLKPKLPLAPPQSAAAQAEPHIGWPVRTIVPYAKMPASPLHVAMATPKPYATCLPPRNRRPAYRCLPTNRARARLSLLNIEPLAFRTRPRPTPICVPSLRVLVLAVKLSNSNVMHMTSITQCPTTPTKTRSPQSFHD